MVEDSIVKSIDKVANAYSEKEENFLIDDSGDSDNLLEEISENIKKGLLNVIDTYDDTSSIDSLTNKIEDWATEKDLHLSEPSKQFLKVIEEVGEIAEGMAKNREEQIKDSIGDVCIKLAYDEIKDRKGKMIGGVFIKQEDLKEWGDILNKKELKRLRYTQEYINTKKIEIDLLKKDLLYIRGLDYSKEHIQGSNVKTQEDLICEIVSQEQELMKKYKELYKDKQIAREKIMLLDDKRYQIILYQYYLLNKSLDDIADTMHYTTRHVQRLHGYALEEIKKV